MVAHGRICLLLALLAAAKCNAYLGPVFSGLEEDLAENTLMPNERVSLDDCYLRFYKQGDRGIVGPAFAKPAFLTEFAHIGAIGWTMPNGRIEWACGGSLIWNNFIITAAHCTANDDNISPDVVRFGDLNLQSDDDDQFAQQLKIVNIIRHPLYRFSAKYNDIALMQLERNVTIHETVAPACLWFDDEIRFKELESAGWGQTGFGEEKTPILLKVTLKPLSNENCTEHYSPKTTRGLQRGLDVHHVCAGDAKMDTCLGDSGGPLHVRLQHNHKVSPFLVGLTSFGRPCGQSHPGVYTKVGPFRSWIVETLQQNGAPEATDDRFEPQACALHYAGIRQLAVSRVVANESGVFETFDITRDYMTSEHMAEVVQLRWPASVIPERNNCMGSIIDHDTIVTLGDCTTHAGITPTQVVHRARAGRYGLDFVDRTYAIKEIHVHPNHTHGSYHNNIAVLKINGSIEELPACIWNAPALPTPEMELFSVGRTDLNVYQHGDKVIFDSSTMRLTPRVYAYDNDNCSLAKQYRDELVGGLLQDEHLCFANDPFLVPQVCDLTLGCPLQRNVFRLQRHYKHVYGLSLFGRDCGYGEPAVAVRLHAHLNWLESVLLPNRSRKEFGKKENSDSVMFINPDLELFDRCDFHDRSAGVCIPVQHCRGVSRRLQRNDGLIFCTNGTVVCCLPGDVLDDAQVANDGAGQIENCETLYGPFRAKNYNGGTENPDPKPHLAEVAWINQQKRQAVILCLGYLITTTSVLTSAVCVENEDYRPNRVRLGSVFSRFEDSMILTSIEEVLTHQQFEARTGANNIALLKLADPIEPTVAVFPVCLWRNETHTPLVATVQSIENMTVFENDVHPQYPSDCERKLGFALFEGQMCMVMSEHTTPNCPTSGDPVYWRRKTPGNATIEYLVGVYSHGNCTYDGLQIGSRITAYLPWILDNV